MTDQRQKSLAAPWAPVGASAQAGSNVSTRVNERLAERAEAGRRRRRRTGARRAVYVVVIGALAWLVLLSPMLSLQSEGVAVDGLNPYVDAAAVTALIDSHEGTSLVMLNTGHVESQLREVRGVREARVERVWPRGLTVVIVPREPVAAVPDPEGGFVLVDDEAVRVGRSESAPPLLPVITVPVGEDHVRVLNAVLGVIDHLPVELRDRVEGITAQTEDSVTFALRDGPRVEWGSAAESALKAEVLMVLLASPDTATATVIDVSAPTYPITRSD